MATVSSALSRAGHPVPGVEPGDLVGLRQRRIVEGIFDKIIDGAFEIEHSLTDVDQLRRAFAHDVDAEQTPRLGRENHFHHAAAQAHDLVARGFAETRDSAFVRNVALADFLLAHPDRRNFRHRIDAVGKEFRRRMGRHVEGVAGRNAALFHGRRCQTGKSDDIAGSVDVRHGGLHRLGLDNDAPPLVGFEARGCEIEVVGCTLAAGCEQQHFGGNAAAVGEPGDHLSGFVNLDPRHGRTEPQRYVAVTQVVHKFLDQFAIDDIIRAEIPDATVADTLKSDVITKLRQQYLDYASKEADWSSRYGPNHLAAVNMRNQMQQTKRAIVDELKRIAQTYRSDYEIARVREESIQQSMSSAITQSQTTSQAQLVLRDLESSAQTYRALHDNFLQRYMESVQQQSFPITEARSISPATRPLRKSHPRSLLILIIGAAGGIMLGAGVGFFRDQLDRVFRTGDQVEKMLKLDCLSILPAINGEAAKPFAIGRRVGNKAGDNVESASGDSALSYATKSPFSRFAESVRAIKVAIDLASNKTGKTNRVIGICSSLPNEGKSTVATNLAQLTAMSGARTILVDCDLRNPSLSRILAPDAKVGILEVLAGTATMDQVLRRDPVTNLAFIPIVMKTRMANSSEILPSEQMKNLFDVLRQHFDYVIVDFPPLAPVVDVRATAHLIDFYLFVVEWGGTKIDVAQHALMSASGVYDQTLGVVLNKANMQ